MSLLLDALKKAEQDKQKAREEEATAAENGIHLSEQEVIPDTLSSKQSADQLEPDNQDGSQDEETEDELELLLDESPVEQNTPALQDSVLDSAKPAVPVSLELEKSSATNTTVSDEALQLLVHKTNKKYRKNQRLVWGSLLLISVIILVASATYSYFGMLDDVNSLEKKHKLAMRSVYIDPVKSVQKETLIEPKKIKKEAKKPLGQIKQKQAAIKKTTIRKAKTLVNAPKNKRDFSIRKTNTEDPINALLRNAWLAYNKSDYLTASSAYKSVLKREPNNRDALLGMAAVAVKSEDYKKAKESYRLLLKLDPRDQVAVSGMSNIDKLSASSQIESKLKFMLQQQPSATHLNFALGNYYARKGRWPEAQAEYFKAWQGNADNADYIYNLAVSLDQLGKKNEALRFYKESLLYVSEQNISFSKADVEERIIQISAK